MVAIASYSELRAALSDYVDHRNISSVLPRLVQMAESKLNRELRTRFQIVSSDLVLANGAVSLPADFLEMVNVYGLNGYQYRSGALSESHRTGSQFSRYTIDGSTLRINGFSGSRTIDYYAALPSLISNTSNWLLQRYPDVYLYAVGLEAAKQLKDAPLVEISQGLLMDAMRSLKVDDDRSRWSNTTVRVNGITP